MDGYVFLRDTSAATLEALAAMQQADQASDGPIRAVAVLSGEYDAVVCVEADGFATLTSVVLDRIRGNGGCHDHRRLVASSASGASGSGRVVRTVNRRMARMVAEPK